MSNNTKTKQFFSKAGSATPKRLGTANNDINTVRESSIPSSSSEVYFAGGHRAWGQLSDGGYISVSIACDKLQPGFYRPINTNVGLALQQTSLSSDNLLILPDSQGTEVVEEIKKFRELEANFRARGLLHKRGILLWGPPGSGKTSTVQQVIDLLVNKHKGIAIHIEHPELAARAFQMIRGVEPKRQIVAIMEDIDALVSRYGESEYLALLDGESQIDNIVFIATTNYPERLDKRFVDRPSRFDTITWIGMPTPEARRAYLIAKELDWKVKDLDYLVNNSVDYSIAHMRELLILVKCLGYSPQEAIARISSMKFNTPDSGNAPNKKKVGFGL